MFSPPCWSGQGKGVAGECTTVLQSTVSNMLMLSLSLTGFLLPNCNAVHVCLSVFPCPWLSSIQVKLAFVLVSCSGPYQSCFHLHCLAPLWSQLPISAQIDASRLDAGRIRECSSHLSQMELHTENGITLAVVKPRVIAVSLRFPYSEMGTHSHSQ